MTTLCIPEARTAAALEARRKRAEASLVRVTAALDEMLRARRPITFAAVAREAQVSRTFLYENAETRAQISAAMDRAAGRRTQDRQSQHDALEASWRERALNTEEALKAAHAEIRTQREQIGELLGQIRDLDTHWSEEDLVRLTTANTALTKKTRELETEKRDLTQKLTAARSNSRFADKRIADLEAQLAEHSLQPNE